MDVNGQLHVTAALTPERQLGTHLI